MNRGRSCSSNSFPGFSLNDWQSSKGQNESDIDNGDKNNNDKKSCLYEQCKYKIYVTGKKKQ